MGFLAWRRADAIGHCLDAALAILAALGAHALHAADRPPPPALAPLVDEVRAVFPPVEAVRPLGLDGDALASAFARRVFRGPVAAADIARS
jgi:histidine ammonia-lyase